MTQKELEQLFSQYGRIITSRILVDQVTGEDSILVLCFNTFSEYLLHPVSMAPKVEGRVCFANLE